MNPQILSECPLCEPPVCGRAADPQKILKKLGQKFETGLSVNLPTNDFLKID